MRACHRVQPFEPSSPSTRFGDVLATSVLILSLALTAAPAMAQPPGRVNGVVRDTDEQPIKGATVTARNENIGANMTATTDDKGRFTLLGLRPGEWAFIAAAPGFAANGGRMAVRSASNLNPPMLFTLSRNGPGAGGALERVTAKDLQTHIANANNLFEQKKWDESIAAYRAITSTAAPLAFVNLQVAAAYIAKNDLPRAQAAYEELLKVDPTIERATVGLAEVQVERGDPQGAEETLTKAAQRDGAGRDVLFALAELKAKAGQSEQAAGWFKKSNEADPYWGRPLYRLGQLAAEKGDSAQATQYLQRVVTVDPASPEAALAKTSLASQTK
jgi:Tfp pilus assembly protein PilF